MSGNWVEKLGSEDMEIDIAKKFDGKEEEMAADGGRRNGGSRSSKII